jgi:glycosyltransferase involved in cell wall biosynthesis
VTASPTDAARPLRVLARPAFAARRNPYTARLYGELARLGVEVGEWSLPRAALLPWDVVHVHWPETVFDHTRLEAELTTRALLRAIDVARARGARLVWTAHNLRAHGRRHEEAEARFRARWLRRLDGVIALTDAGLAAARAAMPDLAAVPAAVVPHPHYRGLYADTCTRAEARAALRLPASARVLAFFGRVAAYKDVPALIGAFRAMRGEDLRLVIAGAPLDGAAEAEVRRAAAGDARVHLHLRFVPDAEAQHYLRAADVVVLPFREILNSGSALLALSFDRPVLAPARGALAELRALAGPSWVSTYEGPLTPAHLADALAAHRDLPERTDGAHLGALAPGAVARATLSAYRRFLEAPPRATRARAAAPDDAPGGPEAAGAGAGRSA